MPGPRLGTSAKMSPTRPCCEREIRTVAPASPSMKIGSLNWKSASSCGRQTDKSSAVAPNPRSPTSVAEARKAGSGRSGKRRIERSHPHSLTSDGAWLPSCPGRSAPCLVPSEGSHAAPLIRAAASTIAWARVVRITVYSDSPPLADVPAQRPQRLSSPASVEYAVALVAWRRPRPRPFGP